MGTKLHILNTHSKCLVFNIQVKPLYFLSNVQTGAQIYIINGLERPSNEREVNLCLVAHLPLPTPPSNFPLKLQRFLKICLIKIIISKILY